MALGPNDPVFGLQQGGLPSPPRSTSRSNPKPAPVARRKRTGTSLMNGAVLNQIAATRDQGEVQLVLFDGDAAKTDDGNIGTTVSEVATARGPAARVHVPSNMLWRLPGRAEEGMLLRGSESGGPYAQLALFGFGEGAAPSWLDSTHSGVSPPAGHLIVESRDESVTVRSVDGGSSLEIDKTGKITATAGTSVITMNKNGTITIVGGVNVEISAAALVTLQGGVLPVARVSDTVGWLAITGPGNPTVLA